MDKVINELGKIIKSQKANNNPVVKNNKDNNKIPLVITVAGICLAMVVVGLGMVAVTKKIKRDN